MSIKLPGQPVIKPLKVKILTKKGNNLLFKTLRKKSLIFVLKLNIKMSVQKPRFNHRFPKIDIIFILPFVRNKDMSTNVMAYKMSIISRFSENWLMNHDF